MPRPPTNDALPRSEKWREIRLGRVAAGRARRSDEAARRRFRRLAGSPIDGATRLANDPSYLDRRLRDVALRHERAGKIRVFGVGLDLSSFYSRSPVLDLGAGIGNAMFREVIELLASRHRR